MGNDRFSEMIGWGKISRGIIVAECDLDNHRTRQSAIDIDSGAVLYEDVREFDSNTIEFKNARNILDASYNSGVFT